MTQIDRGELLKKLRIKGVTIVAVSKTKPIEQILQLREEGFSDFGENRVQELVDKHAKLPTDIRWHMIGNLQKNKVKYIAPFVHLIHSVASASLLQMIDKEASKNERKIPLLLQVKIAEEETKIGLEWNEAKALVGEIAANHYPNIRLKGFMGMATFTQDSDQVRGEFRTMKKFAEEMRDSFPKAFAIVNEEDLILSMGMSGDYEVAIEEGATMVRIGSLLFGPRS